MTHFCEVCGKSFDRKVSLQRHVLIHATTKAHCCELCGQGFSRKDRLVTHKLLHSGERPHVCRYCPKAFRLTKNRNTHERIHTGEKVCIVFIFESFFFRTSYYLSIFFICSAISMCRAGLWQSICAAREFHPSQTSSCTD